MSQLNGDAIEKIQELTLAAVHTQDLKTTICPTVMLPSGYGIESLERFNLNRFRFRGTLETTSIADFVRYSVGYAVIDTPARCFIDAESMSARAVFNIGSLDEPGHADNVASIRLKTAPFRALLAVNGDRLSQKQIAEWLEDWSDLLLAFDTEGTTMDISKAAQAVRRVTIQQTNQAEHEDSDFAGKNR